MKAGFGEVYIKSERALLNQVVTFSFRPEDVVPYQKPFRNRIQGTIQQAIFMGNLTDLFVEVGQVNIRAQLSKSKTYSEGQTIELSIPEEAFRILEREATR